ncbi:tripartite motif-containing protein 2-like [Apostichopus japonicus]|uniref:tripartite motif-containing protein 2-like n=1 Tax=Stichopus japonicus TaxID=307972 RepID=UPI003AB16133
MASLENDSERSQFLKCPVCLEMFNNPKVLNCGHSFCESPCLVSIAGRSAFLKCPECRVVTKVPENDVKNLPTNFSLLRAISEEKDNRNTCTSTCERHNRVNNIRCYTCEVDICKECIQDGHSLNSHDSDITRALDVTSTALFSVQEFRRMLREKHAEVEEAETSAVNKWKEISHKISQSANCAREEINEIESAMLMRLELETEADKQTFVTEKDQIQEMITTTLELEEKTKMIANVTRRGDTDHLHERYQLERDVVALYKDVFPTYEKPLPARSKVLIFVPNETNLSLGDLKIAPLPPKRRPPSPPLGYNVTEDTSEGNQDLASSCFVASTAGDGANFHYENF